MSNIRGKMPGLPGGREGNDAMLLAEFNETSLSSSNADFNLLYLAGVPIFESMSLKKS
jgi:hypothetical protein